MSHISNILTGMEDALAAHFASADIYQRDPLLEDYDRNKVNLFCFPDTVEPDDQPFVAEFRIYKMNVVAKFIVDGRHRSKSNFDRGLVQTPAVVKRSDSKELEDLLFSIPCCFIDEMPLNGESRH